jgi:hypothetical protein
MEEWTVRTVAHEMVEIRTDHAQRIITHTEKLNIAVRVPECVCAAVNHI